MAFIGAAVLLLTAAGCIVPVQPEDELREDESSAALYPDRRFEVVWRTAVSADSNQAMTAVADRLYVTELFADGLAVLDMDDGRLIGRSSNIGWMYTNPTVVDDAVFIGERKYDQEGGPARLARFDLDGRFQHWVEVGPDLSWMVRSFKLATLGRSIYYGTTNGPDAGGQETSHGLVRIDLDTMEEYERGMFRVEPEVIYPTDLEITAPLLVMDDIIVGGGFDRDWREPTPNEDTVSFAVRGETLEVLWESTAVFPQGATFFDVNGTLLMMDTTSNIQVDVVTGDIERTHASTGLWGFPAFSTDGTRVYYAAGTWLEEFDTRDNVVAQSLVTGDVLWSHAIRGTTQGSQPQVHEGIVYFPHQGQVRAYDERTGRILVEDKSISGDPWQLGNTIAYGDLMIINRLSEIVAIRMDVHRDQEDARP